MDSNKKLVTVINVGKYRDLITTTRIMTVLISDEVKMKIMIFNGITIVDVNA